MGTYGFISEISRRRKVRLVEEHVPRGSKILEVGSGDGWMSAQLRASGYSITTIDLEAPADVVGDINEWDSLGLTPDTFDAAIAFEVIEHVDCLEALSSLCRREGLIILSSPHPRWDWVMKILEFVRLTQRRTSPHDHLTDFGQIELPAVVFRRPMYIHQVAIFRNDRD